MKNCYKDHTLLFEIEILPSVISIGKKSFYGCSSLKTVKFHENSSLKKIGKFAFFGYICLKEISIPSSVEIIKDEAFEDCFSLKKCEFEQPSSLLSVGNFAFKGCTSINKIEFSSSVQCGKFVFIGRKYKMQYLLNY